MRVREGGSGGGVMLVALVLAACRPGPVRATDMRPLPAPAEALRQLREGAQERWSMRSLARTTYFGEKGRVRLGTVIVVERPGRFRFETLSPMEEPIDVMASDGERLWLLSGGKLYQGAATRENIARVVPLPLEPEDLVDAMLGGIPTGRRFEPSSIAWADDSQEKWMLTMTASRSGARAELLVDPAKHVVERVRMRGADGNVRLQVDFDDFEPLGAGGTSFARGVKLGIPQGDHEVSIKLKDVELNVSVSPDLFRLEAPVGATILPLDSETLHRF